MLRANARLIELRAGHERPHPEETRLRYTPGHAYLQAHIGSPVRWTPRPGVSVVACVSSCVAISPHARVCAAAQAWPTKGFAEGAEGAWKVTDHRRLAWGEGERVLRLVRVRCLLPRGVVGMPSRHIVECATCSRRFRRRFSFLGGLTARAHTFRRPRISGQFARSHPPFVVVTLSSERLSMAERVAAGGY